MPAGLHNLKAVGSNPIRRESGGSSKVEHQESVLPQFAGAF
jgi:hypothetical protein